MEMLNNNPPEEVDDETYEDAGIPLRKLQENGVHLQDIKKLRDAGLTSVEAVALASKETMEAITGISDMKAAIIQKAASRLVTMSFSIASEVNKKRAETIYITTGSKSLDTLLRGGIETGAITELFGASSSGKTQFVNSLAVTCQQSIQMGGAGGKCLFIDTQGTFRTERFVATAERFKMNQKEVLANIEYARAYTSDQQIRLLANAAYMMTQSRFALLVVDSVTALFRTDYSGLGELAARQQHIAIFMRKLQQLADRFGIAVVITNQVLANVEASAVFGGDKTKPTGGHIIAHASTIRLYLRKLKCGNRVCKVYGSPTLPESEAKFSIKNHGVDDSDD